MLVLGTISGAYGRRDSFQKRSQHFATQALCSPHTVEKSRSVRCVPFCSLRLNSHGSLCSSVGSVDDVVPTRTCSVSNSSSSMLVHVFHRREIDPKAKGEGSRDEATLQTLGAQSPAVTASAPCSFHFIFRAWSMVKFSLTQN